MSDYIELGRTHGTIPTTQESASSIRKAHEHLQRCILALEKIKSIAGPGPILQIADDAMQNKPWKPGGGDY